MSIKTEKEKHYEYIFNKRDNTIARYNMFMKQSLFSLNTKEFTIEAKPEEEINIENKKGQSTYLEHNKKIDFSDGLFKILTEGTD